MYLNKHTVKHNVKGALCPSKSGLILKRIVKHIVLLIVKVVGDLVIATDWL